MSLTSYLKYEVIYSHAPLDRSCSLSQHSTPHELPTTRRRGRKDGAMMLFRNSIYPPALHSLPPLPSLLSFCAFLPSLPLHLPSIFRRTKIAKCCCCRALRCNVMPFPSVRPRRVGDSKFYKEPDREGSQPLRWSGSAKLGSRKSPPRRMTE